MGLLAAALHGLLGKHHPGTGDPRLDLIYGLVSGFLVLFAGLMSGLTLGLCSLDTVELEVRLNETEGLCLLLTLPPPCNTRVAGPCPCCTLA